MNKWVLPGVLAAFVASAACGNNMTGPSNNNANNGSTVTAHGTVGGSIDGSSWNATNVSATNSGNILAVATGDGANPSHAVAFALIVTAPGTYTFGSGTAALGENALLTIGSAGWQANSATGTGSGSITVTTISSTGASGSFNITLAATPGTTATGTKTVAGNFNVTF